MFKPAIAIPAWQIADVRPDTTLHAGVEVREVGIERRGLHLTHVRINPGSRIVGTTHPDEHELVLVMQGCVNAHIGDAIVLGRPGTIFNIPQGVVHGYFPVHGDEVVELLAMYAPAK